MLEIFKKITIEKLRENRRTITFKENESDFISYDEFLKYFKNLDVIEKHHVIISINFVYGWMPTIFNFCSDKFEEVVAILNRAKKESVLEKEEIELLKGCFNNSLVGTSKLLHFINPEKFAIWDSRVYSYLIGKPSYSYRVNDSNTFLDYLKFCYSIIENNKNEFELIHKSIIDEIKREITPLRSLELIMYSYNKKERKRKITTQKSDNLN